jgi:hypothetical protein
VRVKDPHEYDDFIVPSHVSLEDGGPMSTWPGWSRRNWVLREASDLIVTPSPESGDDEAPPV